MSEKENKCPVTKQEGEWNGCPISFLEKLLPEGISFREGYCPVMQEGPAPLATEICSNMFWGAMIGGVGGLLFFRSKAIRRSMFAYGAGVGLGLSGQKLHELKLELQGEKVPDQFESDLKNVQRDLETLIAVSKQ